MANDEDVSMFEPYVTQEDARESLFSMILDNYLLYIDQPDQEFTLDTPLLRGLLEKMEMVDFERLGRFRGTRRAPASHGARSRATSCLRRP